MGALTEEPKTCWDLLSVDELLFVQCKCNKFYALPQFQKRFSDAEQQCRPDMAKYLRNIEPILIEVVGTILLSNELIEDTKPDTVQRHVWSWTSASRNIQKRI